MIWYNMTQDKTIFIYYIMLWYDTLYYIIYYILYYIILHIIILHWPCVRHDSSYYSFIFSLSLSLSLSMCVCYPSPFLTKICTEIIFFAFLSPFGVVFMFHHFLTFHQCPGGIKIFFVCLHFINSSYFLSLVPMRLT